MSRSREYARSPFIRLVKEYFISRSGIGIWKKVVMDGGGSSWSETRAENMFSDLITEHDVYVSFGDTRKEVVAGGKVYFFWDIYVGPSGVLIRCVDRDYEGRRCEIICRRLAWNEKDELKHLLG